LINILIAEDDPVSAAVLEKIIRLEPGTKVTVVSDGEGAMRLLDDPSRSFDILFLDLEMPQLNGFDVLERISGSQMLKSLQIVLCTASNDRNTVERAAALGIRHYLVKPGTKESVTAKLRQLRVV